MKLSTPSEINNTWSSTSPPPYVFMVCSLAKDRATFTALPYEIMLPLIQLWKLRINNSFQDKICKLSVLVYPADLHWHTLKCCRFHPTSSFLTILTVVQILL
jgi:hypothetical protein